MTRTSRFSRLFSLKKNHINHAFSLSKRLGSMPGIKVLYAQGQCQIEEARVLIVPTRQCKGHVRRNLIRRRIKSIIYENDLAAGNATFIILLYQQAQTFSFEQLKNFLIRTMKRELT